jgi:hypothetical protein
LERSSSSIEANGPSIDDALVASRAVADEAAEVGGLEPRVDQ